MKLYKIKSIGSAFFAQQSVPGYLTAKEHEPNKSVELKVGHLLIRAEAYDRLEKRHSDSIAWYCYFAPSAARFVWFTLQWHDFIKLEEQV